MLVELLLGLAGEGALRARVGPLPAMIHLVLLQLPLGAEDLLADGALLRVLRVVDLQVEAEGAQLLEALVALRARVDAFGWVAVVMSLVDGEIEMFRSVPISMFRKMTLLAQRTEPLLFS